MKKLVLGSLAIIILATQVSGQKKFEFTLKNGTEAEKQTKAQMERLLDTYDLSKWIMTHRIEIDEKSIPHSHPILTLSTRHLKDDELLVSTFVHEQMHWFLGTDQQGLAAAISEFKTMFPKVPAGGPDGARSESSTYLHIAVIYLEYRAVREIFGELKAHQIMDFWSKDHYRRIYKTVFERQSDIGWIMLKHKLMPGSAE